MKEPTHRKYDEQERRRVVEWNSNAFAAQLQGKY